MTLLPALRALLPDGVIGIDSSAGGEAAPLFPEEEVYLGRAVDKRRREFALGRTYARRALVELGRPPAPLVPLADRSVPWPAGTLGTITHAEGYVGVLVAERHTLAGLGLDAEERGRVHERIWKQIASAREIAWLRAAGQEASERATLLFSAKEAFYKAQYCVSQQWVGFHDVELEAQDGQFVIELVKPIAGLGKPGTRFVGRYVLTPEHVLTICTITAPY